MHCNNCFEPIQENDRVRYEISEFDMVVIHEGTCAAFAKPKVAYRLRPFCREERHLECSVVQEPTNAAPYYMVCSCYCHMA